MAAIASLPILALSAVSERVTVGERVHYTFDYRECERGAFTQWAAAESSSSALAIWAEPGRREQRLLRPTGQGADCIEGRNGVLFNASDCCCSAREATCPAGRARFAPLHTSTSEEAELGHGMRDGLTLEIWLRPAESSVQRRVIAAVGVQAPSSALACDTSREHAGSFTSEGSMVLFQNEQNCIEIDLALPGGGCMRLPAFPTYCTVAGFPPIDAQHLHHVVLTLSHNLGNPPFAGSAPRFALYIDGIRVVDADNPPNIGSALDIEYEYDLGSWTSRYILNDFGPAEYEPHTLWPEDHMLRFGSDGYVGDGALSPWEGEVAMFAAYGRPLMPLEVAQNHAAGIDNSAPLASGAVMTVAEDSCSKIPPLNGFASDADNQPPFSRNQTLSISLDPSSLERGALYSDSDCTEPLPTIEAIMFTPPLYFRPAADEHSEGGTYARLRWTVSDDAPAYNGSDSALLTFAVSPVNDPPVPLDAATTVYLGLATLLLANGTDVDAEDPAHPVGSARLTVRSLPAYGELREVLDDGSPGAPLGVGSSVPNATLFYRSTYDFGSTTGLTVVAHDAFQYQLRDSQGLESVSTARYDITILSGLDAIAGASEALEEEPTVIELRGINQRSSRVGGGGAAATTAFAITQLPRSGTLSQYDPGGYLSRGAVINESGIVLWDSNRVCADDPAFLCPRLVYEGDRDFFSVPTRTRAGRLLNVTDDLFAFNLGTAGETSPDSTHTVRVYNVNDPPTILAPANTTYLPNMANSIARAVQIVDPDLGVGTYRLEFKVVGSGGVTEASHKQLASEALSWAKWQSSMVFVKRLLGYCPHACAEGYACLESCTDGNGYNDATLRFFVAADTAPAVLESISYRSEAFASTDDGLAIKIAVEDFDDGEGLGQSAAVHTSSVEMRLFFAPSGCTSLVTGSCSPDTHGGSGIVSWVLGASALATVVALTCFLRRRQRRRVLKYGPAGERRPRCVRGRDMRVWLPLWSLLGLLAHVLLFLARCAFSPYALFRMDLWGDSFCGANATQWPEPNRGCRSGQPDGFSYELSLGDAMFIGVAGPLVALELDGRPSCRLYCSLWALAWLIVAVVKFGLFRAWEKAVPDPPWTYHDEFSLANGAETRPMQNSMVSLIFLFLGLTPLLVLGAISCAAGGRLRRRCCGGRESDESGSESEDETVQRRRGVGRRQRAVGQRAKPSRRQRSEGRDESTHELGAGAVPRVRTDRSPMAMHSGHRVRDGSGDPLPVRVVRQGDGITLFFDK